MSSPIRPNTPCVFVVAAPAGYAPLTKPTMLRLRGQAEVRCPEAAAEAGEAGEAVTACRPTEAPCLFNIREDPCERVNLAAARPQVLQSLEEALARYRRSMVPPGNVPTDPLADPALWNGTWTNWCSEQDERQRLGDSAVLAELSAVLRMDGAAAEAAGPLSVSLGTLAAMSLASVATAAVLLAAGFVTKAEGAEGEPGKALTLASVMQLAPLLAPLVGRLRERVSQAAQS